MATIIRTAQVVGITTSLVLSGVYAGSSIISLPSIYSQPPSVSTPVFNQIYTRGAVTVLPMAAVSALCTAYLAYETPALRNLYTVAAVATISTMPWTILFMKGTNERLNAIAASKLEQEKVQVQEVDDLLKDWVAKNYVRCVLALTGGLAGLSAVLEGSL